ncbi:hypothetical protein BN2475_50187 [Paraburkholderia ribeironis]|uniref:Uncharacterized protein n=1 Tax=Paraburkholderia ribeironis TaxID=1247936 RepID=A0A1N7RKT0_9BURK|nr:hypothetical protein BN2475_50187 [Paraburkholderia ribeironis]
MHPVSAMLNGVRPADWPAVASEDADTVGSATEKLFVPVLPPLMVQVWAVMLPVKVMVPSAACEANGRAAIIATAAEIIAERLSFIGSPLFRAW